ncbi:MAG: glucosidase [Planctomycetes bacterium]|nr:glucosidase [Planctomycetota bacterium]
MNERTIEQTDEYLRLQESKSRAANWQRWGAYLSERQWGTVREDYSNTQDAWHFLPHDHARSRAYRWGEDGLLGICDRQGRLCFSFAFWNTRDPILKERLFGLTGPEGNHGEDVKECYYYVDGTPTQSYMKGLYKYPQARFPYEKLVDGSRSRSRFEPEFELADAEAFENNAYFDCQVEYAKESPDDVLIRLTVHNRGPRPAVLHILPQLWFHNSWVWGCTHEGCTTKPRLRLIRTVEEPHGVVLCDHETLGQYEFRVQANADGESPAWLFTDNETNPNRHPLATSVGRFFKDAFHEYVLEGNSDCVNPQMFGTKCAAHYMAIVHTDRPLVLRCRLTSRAKLPLPPYSPPDQIILLDRASSIDADFDTTIEQRIVEADEYYDSIISPALSQQEKSVARQAYAGLIWTKQFYYYVVDAWLTGDPECKPLPVERKAGRNGDWQHLFNRDVISMPDKWEYPWYAAWDLAFHMIPMAKIDVEFAKNQLILFLREWYMHPNGQIPAYEWALSDVNPPVHAWACWQVYKQSGDRDFLARTFQKLLLNFTWWVNRKDTRGQHVFSGGFLGLDNIGVFDRSKPLPGGGTLDQADATAWMAFYCGGMLQMALELAHESQAYSDMASKFFEHYVAISEAMNSLHGSGLWDEGDGFYYDHVYRDGRSTALKVRSLVGLIPLCTNVILHESTLHRIPSFTRRMDWFLKHKPHMSRCMTYLEKKSSDGDHSGAVRLLAIPSTERLRRLLTYMLDEREFLSPYGIRSLSAIHHQKPFVFDHEGSTSSVSYVPGESNTGMFGGNSNWRGPIWFPLNHLIIESLRSYHKYFGDSFQIECPTGSGQQMNLLQVANELERRLVRIFLAGTDGTRPCHGGDSRYANDPNWRDLVLFYEYFHGDNGKGLGASHQTGWTALVATMLEHQANSRANS